MVSIDRPIPHFNKFPFMLDIQDEFVFCYINSLKHHANPLLLLQNAWYASMTLYEKVVAANIEGNRAVEEYQTTIGQYKRMVGVELQNIKETRALIRNLQGRLEESEKNLMSSLNYEFHRELEAGLAVVCSWWDSRMVKQVKSRIKSSVIYEEFKKGGSTISIEVFRSCLMEILKSEKGAIQKSRSTLHSDDFTVVGWEMAAIVAEVVAGVV
jgi:hypothetical protein